MHSERLIESDVKPPSQRGEVLTSWAARLQAVKQLTHPIQVWAGRWRAAAAGWQPRASRAGAVAKRAAQWAGTRAGQSPVRSGLAQVWRTVRAGSGEGTLRQRYSLHLVVLCLAVGVVLASRVSLPQIDVLFPTPNLDNFEGGVISGSEQPSNRGMLREASEETGLLAAPVAHTLIAERARTDVITYTVQAYDNMWSIAQKFELQVDTMLWANPSVESNPDLLSVDQVLDVPPVDGLYYTVKKGDTLAKLAKTYKTSVDKITGWPANSLVEPYELTVGQRILLVGGKKPQPAAPIVYPLTRVRSAPPGAPQGTGKFAWPTRGWLTQRFYGEKHTGIDIGNRVGTPVYAADDGYVVLAGLDTTGYGIQIVIDHGNGFWTRYAHLDKLYVTAGDIVKKNQRIADMGNTGHSTGPHLHFEIIKDKTQRNPLTYLP